MIIRSPTENSAVPNSLFRCLEKNFAQPRCSRYIIIHVFEWVVNREGMWLAEQEGIAQLVAAYSEKMNLNI